MELTGAERRRHLRQLQWSIWKTRAANFRLYHKAVKLLIALIIAYPVSFFLVFDVFIINIPPVPGAPKSWLYWNYPATTDACIGEKGLEENLTNACVIGPSCPLWGTYIEWEVFHHYDGDEWPFRFYAPLVRYYKYLRRNDFKGQYR